MDDPTTPSEPVISHVAMGSKQTLKVLKGEEILRESRSWTFGVVPQETVPRPTTEQQRDENVQPQETTGGGTHKTIRRSVRIAAVTSDILRVSSTRSGLVGDLQTLHRSPSHSTLRAVRSWTGVDQAATWKFFHSLEFLPHSMKSASTVRNTRQGNDLCSVCRTINVEALVELDTSKLTNEGVSLCAFTGLSSLMLRSGCPACRAFASLLPQTLGSPQGSVSGALLVLPVSSISGIPVPKGAPRVSNILGVSLESNPIRWDAVAGCSTELQGLFIPAHEQSSTVPGACCGLELHPQVDFNRLRKMFSQCAKEHKFCQTPTENFPVRARVIDCKARKVVDLEPNKRYLALSYVWGARRSANISSVGNDIIAGILPLLLPQTIEDAIIVTRKLGLQYLWVDRYCIEQFHSADKKHQISQMARIYNRAVATICALGSNDNAGLPGITKRRATFLSFSSRGVVFSTIPAPFLLQKQISTSVWSTRGWTFQEALLSRRCIFFTTEQAHLVCRGSCQHEGIVQVTPMGELDNHSSSSANTGILLGSTATIFSTILDAELRWMHGMHGRLKFFDYMQHYLKRHFTVESDVFPAFKGVLSIIDNQSYFGIVVFYCPGSGEIADAFPAYLKRLGFVHGLLWDVDCRTNHNRHPSVPSWSWMSLKYSKPQLASLDSDLSLARNSMGLACVSSPLLLECYVADIHVENEDGRELDIGQHLEQYNDLKIVPEITPILRITTMYSKVDWTLLYNNRKRECTFSLDKQYVYKLEDHGARFDSATFRDSQTGIALLLLMEKHVPDMTTCIHRWLVLKGKGQKLLDFHESYERIGLLTWKERIGSSATGTDALMLEMVERNASQRATFRVE